MANYNARDFLRDSIAGNTSGGISQPKTNASSNSNLDDSQIPPILVVPPNTNKEEFVDKIEKIYSLNFSEDLPSINHELSLLDSALSAFNNKELNKASNLLSLCLLLSDNYLYNYLLALVRSAAYDYIGANKLLEKAVSQIRAQQQINQELKLIIKEINFSECFYVFYTYILLCLTFFEKAEKICNFILDNKIIKNQKTLNFLKNQFYIAKNPLMIQKINNYFTNIKT